MRKYFANSVLADITLITVLFKFTPGGEQFVGTGWLILSFFVVLKEAFYIALHLKSLQIAREINVALRKGKIELQFIIILLYI
jgi:hypothetical protein